MDPEHLLVWIPVVVAGIVGLDRLLGRWIVPDRRLSRIEEQVEILSETTERSLRMHEAYDEDGVPVWHNKQSTARTLEKLASSMRDLTTIGRAQTDILSRIATTTESTNRIVDRIDRGSDRPHKGE